MTETLIPKLDREKAFDDWFDALRGGNFTQGTGALCKEDADGNREHCCVGVLDEVVYETTWTPANYEDDYGNKVMFDKFGEEGNMEPNQVKDLGLDKLLTETEVERLLAYTTALDTEDTRIAALAVLNDDGVDWDTLVMLMEEFNWKED